MKLSELHDLTLQPFDIEGFETAIKHFVLFSRLNENSIICITNDYLIQSLDYLSKNDFNAFEVVLLDDISFDRLYQKTLELKTEKSMSGFDGNEPDVIEDFGFAEFLRNSVDIMTSEESAPIIKFVNSLFYQAVKKASSDIHIETHEYKGEIRYRINGILTKHIELDKGIISLVISRIKVISNLDISEKRVPQDGRTQVKIAGKTLDIRVSILPTYYGERVVMRILSQSEDVPTLGELGFVDDVVKKLEKIIQNPYGMVLVCGPTGSGKSTTLHSLLQKIISPEKNIITVEDPVEYKSNKISQIQVNSKVGLTFANGLRSILRQDPDIIMVGEIRDSETAKIAIQAALTGHLVFSTLHTNNSVSTVNRLVDMGIDKFLISSSLLAVLAQRLVRVLCDCKEEDFIAENFVNEFNLPLNHKIYKAKGCKKCNFTGFIKRIAVGELFVIDDEIKKSLKFIDDDEQLMKLAQKKAMTTLKEQIKQTLLDGNTSLDEAIRVGM